MTCSDTSLGTPRETQADGYDPGFCTERNRHFVLVAAVLASALGFIDGSSVSIAIPAIRAGLGASLVDAQWINNSYMLTLSALILAGGAAGDRFGLARVFFGGILLFVLASAACALAPTPAALIWLRALQGAGAALMIPGSLAIISRAFPKEDRGRAIGIWAAASAATTAIGPVIGGTLLTLGGDAAWRLIFAINLPLGAAALWLVWHRIDWDEAQEGEAIDWPGAALATLGLGLVAWALTGSEGEGAGPARAGLIGGLGAAVLALFLLAEFRARHPMMPPRLFASATFSAANAATFALYFALSAVLFFLPMTAITAWGVSEIAVSASFLPFTALVAILSPRLGSLADRYGPGPLIAAGAGIVAVAFAGMAATAPAALFWSATVPLMALMGLGMSLVVAPLSTAVMGAVPDEESGAASGINNAVSRTAGLVAVAAMGPVASAAYGAAGGPESFGEPAASAGHAAASSAGFAAVAWLTTGIAAFSALLSLFFIRRV